MCALEGNRLPKINAQVVVGTPGTVMSMIKNRLLNPQRIKIFVLDEADMMLNKQGMGDQSIRVKKYVHAHANSLPS